MKQVYNKDLLPAHERLRLLSNRIFVTFTVQGLLNKSQIYSKRVHIYVSMNELHGKVSMRILIG